MKKRKAFRIGQQFLEDYPEYEGELVRISIEASIGYDVHTEVYRVNAAPKGGMQDSVHVSTLTNGALITYQKIGDVIMTKVFGYGLPKCHSFPVLPHDESGNYARMSWSHKFSTEQRVESMRWAIRHGLDKFGVLDRKLAHLAYQEGR